MATSLIGVFSAVSNDRVMASAAALASFGIAGEDAVGAAGPSSYRTALNRLRRCTDAGEGRCALEGKVHMKLRGPLYVIDGPGPRWGS